LGCAQLGSRDNIANPPNVIEDEIKKRLFIVINPHDDIEFCFPTQLRKALAIWIAYEREVLASGSGV